MNFISDDWSIWKFSDLIQLSKECSDFTTSLTEVDALKEGAVKFDFSKISLTSNQMKILFNDNTNSLIKQIIDQSSGTISTFGRDLIEKTFSKNPDFLFLLEYFTKFNESSPPKNLNQILPEKFDPLSYFLFIQQIFDSISTIPINMDTEQKALSEIIKYIIFHTNSLSLIENISGFNNEILKITKNVPGANLQLFKPIFQDCYIQSVVHKNRISKDTINNIFKRLLEQSGAEEAQITKLDNGRENYYTLLSTLTSLIYYRNYLKNDTHKKFYPYGQIQGEIKAKTNFMIEKVGQLLTHGKTSNGMHKIRLTVNWEKAFKDTRLSKATFIEITYQNAKKTYEINDKEGENIEIVLPSFSKTDDTVEISLVYVKEKYNDTLRKKVPQEGIGTLVTFLYPLKTDTNSSSSSNPKTAAKNKSRPSSMTTSSTGDFIVEFKRGDSSLSTKWGTITLKSKYYDFNTENATPEVLEENIYLTKSESGGFSDNFQMKEFLDFLITNLVNQWISNATKSGSTSMSIYPPQESYIGLIEFSMRYSIPASTIYLLISKELLKVWCHAESYLNAFTATFITAHVCMMNNKKLTQSLYTNKQEEELYRFIHEFLAENIPMYLIQHFARAGLYQNHGIIPLLTLLSFIIPEEGIDSYLSELIRASHKITIRSIASYLKPTTLENDEINSEKMAKEVSDLLNFINSYPANVFDKLMKNEIEIDFTGINSSKITFSIKSLADTIDFLNKRTQQLNKFYEKSSLPAFLSNQWEAIKGDLCQFAVILVKLFLQVLKEKFGDDQSIFKFIFSYRELHNFFYNSKNNQNSSNISSKSKMAEDEITSEEFSPFKLFLNVILDWISRIGEQMAIWISNAVNIDTFEIDDKKLKTSSSPKDMFEVFRQSFTFLYSLQWEDPSIEIFVSTFLSLCGSCLRDFIEKLTFKMLSYFPIEVLQESQIEAVMHYLEDLESNVNNNNNNSNLIATKSIFVIINDFMNLRLMWNGFLVQVKKMFPSLFSEEEKGSTNNKHLSLSSASKNSNSSSLLTSSNIIELPPN